LQSASSFTWGSLKGVSAKRWKRREGEKSCSEGGGKRGTGRVVSLTGPQKAAWTILLAQKKRKRGEEGEGKKLDNQGFLGNQRGQIRRRDRRAPSCVSNLVIQQKERSPKRVEKEGKH